MTARLAAALAEARHLCGDRVLLQDGEDDGGRPIPLTAKALKAWIKPARSSPA